MTASLWSLGFLLLTSVSAAPQASPSLASQRCTTTVCITSTLPTATPSTSPSALPSLTTEERDELFSLHEELVSIPSISEDEVECADYISEYLEELGYHVEKVPVGNTSTYNVFAYPTALKEEGAWPEVLITSHIDTVCASPQIELLGAHYNRYRHFIRLSDEKRMAQFSTTDEAQSMPKDQ
jgi:acetylornithine deacetylase